MKNLKTYAKRFFKEDEGAELIEWAIIVAIAAILVGVAFTIVANMSNAMNESGQLLDDTISEGLSNAKGGGGNTDPAPDPS